VINHGDGIDGANHEQAYRFAQLLKEQGVLTSWRFCTSMAHTEKDVGDTLDRADEVLKIMREEFGGL